MPMTWVSRALRGQADQLLDQASIVRNQSPNVKIQSRPGGRTLPLPTVNAVAAELQEESRPGHQPHPLVFTWKLWNWCLRPKLKSWVVDANSDPADLSVESVSKDNSAVPAIGSGTRIVVPTAMSFPSRGPRANFTGIFSLVFLLGLLFYARHGFVRYPVEVGANKSSPSSSALFSAGPRSLRVAGGAPGRCVPYGIWTPGPL